MRNNTVDHQSVAQQVIRRTKKRKIPRYFKLCLSVLGLYLVFAFVTSGYQIWQLNKQIHVLEGEQDVLLQKQQGLTNEIQSLNDPESIERIARESLGMVKKGETVVVPAIPEKNIPKPKEVSQSDMGD
jgi:cell division protein FtsL